MIQSTHPACLKPLNRAVKANTTERRALPLQFTTTNREEFFCFSSQSLPLHVKTQLMTMIKQLLLHSRPPPKKQGREPKGSAY